MFAEFLPRQARLASAGAVRTLHLPAETRDELRALLEELFDATLTEDSFRQRWAALDLADADGLPHLKSLIEGYYQHFGVDRVEGSKELPRTPGPGQTLGLLAVYLGELENPRVSPPSSLPLPARPPIASPTLPLPSRAPDDH